MGCDIHLFTERQMTINGVKQWVNVDNWKINPWFDGDEESRTHEIKEVYRGRNYALFSMLADVRNNGEHTPICNPRGLPTDVSDIIKWERERWGSDGHSHSYLTVKELKEYLGKCPTMTYSGMVDEEGRRAIDEGGMPDSWCSWTNMSGFEHRKWVRENKTMKEFISLLEKHFDDWGNIENWSDYRIVFWFDN